MNYGNITKLYKSNNKYHAVLLNYFGKISHKTFETELEARNYIRKKTEAKVSVENVD